MSDLNRKVQEAKAHLDAHAVEIVKWHFSPEISPFWLDWAKKAGWNPATDITRFDISWRSSLIFKMNGCAIYPTKSGGQRPSGGKPFSIFETAHHRYAQAAYWLGGLQDRLQRLFRDAE